MLSIGAFSKISRVTTNTLRYYDEIGLLRPASTNSENGYRYYEEEQLKTMLLINRLKSYAFTLEEIAEVLRNPFDNNLVHTVILQKRRNFQETISQYQDTLLQMERDIRNLERGTNLMAYLNEIEVKLIETKPQNILFIRANMSTEDYSKYMGKLFETIFAENLTPAGPPMTIYHSEEFNPDQFDAEIAVPVKENTAGTKELPGSLCATATLKGAYPQLTSLYTRIPEWMEQEGYCLGGAPYEVYLTNPQDTAPEDSLTAVYFPVKKKN